MKFLDEQYYHVFNRGSRSEKIFFSIANYEYFLRLLTKNAATHLIYLVAYCLMPNHYHLVLQQKENGCISKFIQSVMTSYVQAINKKYNTSGTLFQGKAKAKLIDSNEYILQVIRYIHLNPVSARLAQVPQGWQFSDYRKWIETDLFSGISRIDNLRDSYFVNANEYQKFVEEYQFEQKNNKIEKFLFDDD
jgi:REP element-mobilizing transposase RayT